MARYVIANRRAGKFSRQEKVAARSLVAETMSSIASADVVHDNDPLDEAARRVAVVEADPNEMAARMADLPPDVIVEPEILHWISSVPPSDLARAAPAAAQAVPMGGAAAATIEVTGDGAPLARCKLQVYFRGWSGTQKIAGSTDTQGRFAFVPPAGSELAAVVAVPAGDYWPMVVRGPQAHQPIDCPRLPRDGPAGWWHRIVGAHNPSETLGAGIRVGVIDTGLARHMCLAHATAVGSYIDGGFAPGAAAADDLDGHGTHVAGTIAGRAADAGQYSGIAPAAEIFAARVFPPGKGASNADIANAIDALSRDHRVDLVNMSLGSPLPSQVVRDAIIDAYERGTVCVVAAGNDNTSVRYPAAFPECVSVSALGLAGWGPAGSLSASRLPQTPELFGRDNLYLANFSCFGSDLDCAAPGVGILAPICDSDGSDRFFAAMDGTSMATPVACGAFAALLSAHSSYVAFPRNSARAHAARAIFTAALRDVGLGPSFQGRGVPYLS